MLTHCMVALRGTGSEIVVRNRVIPYPEPGLLEDFSEEVRKCLIPSCKWQEVCDSFCSYFVVSNSRKPSNSVSPMPLETYEISMIDNRRVGENQN